MLPFLLRPLVVATAAVLLIVLSPLRPILYNGDVSHITKKYFAINKSP